MAEPEISFSPAVISTKSEVLFSVYGVDWGYCAFALLPGAVCEELGAADESRRQLLLAYELGKRRLVQIVKEKSLPETGERVTLSSADLVVAN